MKLRLREVEPPSEDLKAGEWPTEDKSPGRPCRQSHHCLVSFIPGFFLGPPGCETQPNGMIVLTSCGLKERIHRDYEYSP